MTQTAEIKTPLKLATVAFTGRLAALDRRQAWTLVREAGGMPAPAVSRRVTHLVVGMSGWPLLSDGKPTRSLQQADSLQRRGHGIRILSEEAFLELLGMRERKENLRKSFDLEQVAEATGVETEAIRLWDRLGLVRSHEGHYDFQDIVSLKTIARLLNDGVDPAEIQRSIRSLSAFLPGTERPLAQLSLVARPGGIAAEVGGSLLGPGGQLHLRFEPDRGMDAAPLPLVLSGGADGAEQWLDVGLEAEEDGRLNDAEGAYRKAIDADPADPACQYNLANVLLVTGRRGAAEERFRQALSLDPKFSEAWYNLAITLDESGRPHEAAAVLERLISTDPSYADAYFNLAELYERLSRPQNAIPLWRAFLKLEPRGEWADRARSKLG